MRGRGDPRPRLDDGTWPPAPPSCLLLLPRPSQQPRWGEEGEAGEAAWLILECLSPGGVSPGASEQLCRWGRALPPVTAERCGLAEDSGSFPRTGSTCPRESLSVSSEFVEAACPGAPLQSGPSRFDASSPSPSKTQGCCLLFLLELMGFE